MAQLFEREGISLRYPESWRLAVEEVAGGWSAELQSPGTAFLSLTCDQGMPEPEDMADAVLEALREDYPTLEAEDCVETIGGQAAVGNDINFFSLDLTNSCWTRCLSSGAGTLLLMCQVNDLELEEHGPVLQAICASLRVEE